MAVKSLSSKILLLALLNLAGLALATAFFLRGSLGRFELDLVRDKVRALTNEIALELEDTPADARTALLGKYRARLDLDLYLFENSGKQLGGPPIDLPSPLRGRIAEGSRRTTGEPPPTPPRGSRPGKKKGPPPFDQGRLPNSVFYLKTGEPAKYWIGSRIPIFDPEADGPALRGTLFLVTDSLLGHGFFGAYASVFQYLLAALTISTLCWLPFIRNLTKSVKRMEHATGLIADGQFNVDVSESRRDEVGALASSIHQMATKLKGYVEGQKLFLAGVAHELRSPLARMELEVELLSRGATPQQHEQLNDLREDVEHLRGLVDELMAFSRSNMRSEPLPLVPVNVLETINRAVTLEANPHWRANVQCAEDLDVLADRDSLFRAIANLVRNSHRYASPDGPVTVTAQRKANRILITVTDQGSGVPDDQLENIFKPFYRLQSDRDRKSGGTGLGLAIVKSSVEAMHGSVNATNLRPCGFAVEISLVAL